MGSAGRIACLGAAAGVAALLLAGCGDGGKPYQHPTGGTAQKSPRPVWSGLESPFEEPPLAGPPAVVFGISRVAPSASQTVFAGRHTLPASSVGNYRIGVFLHDRVFRYQRDAKAAIGADGSFSVTLPRAVGEADRALLVLYPAGGDPLAGAHCDARAGSCKPLSGAAKIALPVDPARLTAWTAAYFPAAAGAANPQIAALQGMMNTPAIHGGQYGDGRLVRSFRDMDSAFLYDEALAVIAFSLAGDRLHAEAVLNAMAGLQEPSGAWQFAYETDGRKAKPKADMRIAGANAWFGMALNAYQKAFDSSKYLAMSTRLHDYLVGEMVAVTVNGTAQRGLRFAPANYVPGRTGLFALEHQVDAYAAMHQYVALNGGRRYQLAAADLQRMAESLWNGTRFVPGYDAGSQAFNTTERYLDNYSWAVLALGNTGTRGQKFAASLPAMCDYFSSSGKLDYPSRKLSGLAGFDEVIRNGEPTSPPFVWSEGSLGAVMAMRQGAPGMTCAGNTAADILESLRAMAGRLGGVPYASGNGTAEFTSSASVAGTAWLYFADQNKNPYAHY